ncbi:hypothetical protein QOT17_019287 [Balamuthia mandrillaris]
MRGFLRSTAGRRSQQKEKKSYYVGVFQHMVWHNYLTNGGCLVGQQRSLVITNPRKEQLMNAIHCGGLPMGKKWRAIQQFKEDSKCSTCNAEHFLFRCPNLWEDNFRIWNENNGDEEQVRKLIIEDFMPQQDGPHHLVKAVKEHIHKHILEAIKYLQE